MVKVLQRFLLWMVVFCASLGVQAQGATINITTFEDTPVSYTLLSRNTPFITQTPQNGSLSLMAGPLTYQYILTYTPDSGYLGLNDQARVLSFPIQNTSFTITVFNFRVVAVELDANHDIAHTVAGTAVSVPVLANDYSSSGFLELRAIPVSNAGTALIDGNHLIFTPAEGFSGLTEVNYLVCTTNDICAMGTVSVNVLHADFSSARDTTLVFTKREKPQLILAPNNFSPINEPVNGTYGWQNGVRTYTPNTGFVGLEYLNFAGTNGDVTTFTVEVLDMKDQAFSTDDLAYTLVGSSVAVNVLSNDYYGSFTGCITYNAPQFGSLSSGPSPGRVIYTPPVGWSGVDRFTYRSYEPGCPGEGELATVYIVVDDFAPAQDAISITTVSAAPTPLTYEVPTGTVVWSVTTAPSAGSISYEDGQIIYTPAVAEGSDFLAITYCLEGENGDCATTKTVAVDIQINPTTAIACEEECVWPGDTNNDGLVDLNDFLSIGLNMGSTGTPRLAEDPEMWCPQASEDWEISSPSGVNLKYVDANGDQLVSALDTQVVMANYGLSHQLQPNPTNTSAFDIILDGDVFAEPGDLLAIDVLLGTNLVGVEDIYGFRFPFPYDPSIFVPESINLVFEEDSWLSYGSPVISTQVNRQETGDFQAAYIRTNGKPMSGYGQVGTLYVGVEDIYGFRNRPDEVITTSIGGHNAAVVATTGDMQAVRVQPLEIKIQTKNKLEELATSAEINQYLDGKLLSFPNPSSGRLTVHLNGQQTFDELSVVDRLGRLVLQEKNMHTNHQVLDLGSLPNGMYILSVTTPEGVVNRKIEIVH